MNPSKQDISIACLKAGSNETYQALYAGNFPAVERMITLHGGNTQDAEDAFQEAILALYKKAAEPGFTLSAPPSHFIIAAARRQWLKRLRDRKRFASQPVPEVPYVPDTPHAPLSPLYRVLKKLTSHCLMLLSRAFLMPRKQHNAVAEELGYKNRHSYDNQKYKCLQHARKLVNKG